MIENGQTEESLRETQRILLSLTGNLAGVTFRCRNDKRWPLDFISEDCLALTGYTSSELTDGNIIAFNELIHRADQADVWSQVQKGLAENRSYEIVYRIINRSGEEKWVWEQGHGEYDSEGNLLYITGLITDITTRKRAVDELQKQKIFYESTLHTMPVELVVLDPEQRYVFCNQTAIRSDELRNWIIGKNDFEYCSYRGRDVTIAQARQDYFSKAVSDRTEVEWEEVVHGAAGKNFSLKRYTPIVDQENELKMIIGYGFNITAMRRAEEKVKENEQLLQTINANIQDGIYRITPEKGLVYVNQAFVEMFGYQSIEEMLENPMSFFNTDIKSRKLLMNILDRSGSFSNKEVLFHKKDGGKFWGLVSCIKTTDENDNVYYDGAVVDITEFKKTEDMLRQKNVELQKANAELDRFVYSASHDLRAPLTSILGIINVAEMEIEDPDQHQYFTMIRNCVNKLDSFVQDIIHYSRNSRVEAQKVKINFNRLVSETFENLKFLAGADKILIKILIDDSYPFFADPGRLSIILNNIISNAIKYHNPAEKNPYISVQVKVSRVEAVITIADNGRGIDARYKDKIFDMFYRATQENVGSGLGLYIVKEAINKLEGSIAVESEIGVGSKFTIKIPNQKQNE